VGWRGLFRGLSGAPGRGLSEVPGGASNSLAPALIVVALYFCRPDALRCVLRHGALYTTVGLYRKPCLKQQTLCIFGASSFFS